MCLSKNDTSQRGHALPPGQGAMGLLIRAGNPKEAIPKCMVKNTGHHNAEECLRRQ